MERKHNQILRAIQYWHHRDILYRLSCVWSFTRSSTHTTFLKDSITTSLRYLSDIFLCYISKYQCIASASKYSYSWAS